MFSSDGKEEEEACKKTWSFKKARALSPDDKQEKAKVF